MPETDNHQLRSDRHAPAGHADGEIAPGPGRREPIFNLAGVVVFFIAVCAGVHIVRSFLSVEADLGVLLRFAFIPARYFGGYLLDAYAFASPVTYSLLHGGVLHLAVNMIWLAAFGSPLANRIGTARFVAFWIATALGAVGLHYVLHSTEMVPLVGASGSISGMMGAAARFAFRIDRSQPKPAFSGPILSMPDVFRSRQAVTFLAVWMAVNLMAGIGFGAPEMGGAIAWEAHIGGFLVGFLALPLFDRRPVGAR